jgi:CRISPR-associated protein Csx10
LSLGKSRSAGYGQAQLTFVQPATSWDEYEPALQEPGDFVGITLLSDALIRDQNGVYVADISAALAPAGLSTAQLQPDRSIFKTKLVGGFNRKWNLPLPQAWAVQMGSIFVYSAQGVNRAELARLVESGIGERRAEGFGRIAVDWHRYTEVTGYKVRVSRISNDPDASPPPYPRLTPHGQKLAQRIVTYQLRRELDVALLRTIVGLKISGEPSRSQLSRVRLVARRVLESVLEKKALSSEGKLTELDTFLTDIQGKTAQQVLQRSRIGSQNLYDWLKSHILPAQVVQTLAWQDQPPQLLGEIKANFGDDTSLQIEYTARLVEGVVKQELDRQRREGGSNA